MKFLIFTLFILVAPFSFAHAQVGMSLAGQDVTIDLEPAHPEPRGTFTASLNDYSFSSQVTSINWKVDNVSMPNAKDQRSLVVVAKDAGTKMTIEASITVSGQGTKVIRKTITPLYLDVVVEAQTKTPVFYQGRGLPSIGSTVNLTALLGGHSAQPSAMLYTWRVNNTVIGGGSIRGKNNISIETPIGQTFLVTVDISALDGSLISRRTLQLPSVSPSVHFYETSTLYGVKNKAIKTLNLVGSSATIKAEPYNLNIETYNNPDHLEWKVDGITTNTTGRNPYEITVARPEEGYTGTSRASLHVRSLSELLQGGEGEFTINF